MCVCVLTFEPLLCRPDHGITLCPVKFNHPVRENRTHFEYFNCACKCYNCIFLTDKYCRERTYPSMCCKKPSSPQLCSSWDTMSWKRAGISVWRHKRREDEGYSRSSYSGSAHTLPAWPPEMSHWLYHTKNSQPTLTASGAFHVIMST